LQDISLSDIFQYRKTFVHIFKTRAFDLWATKIKLSDKILQQAIVEVEHGLYEANLGGYIYKKRIALGNKGKSGGARTIIAFKHESKAIFVYGFSKNQKANINPKELMALKKLAKAYFDCTQEQIKIFLETEEFIEVK
jgi:hypothetical protein